MVLGGGKARFVVVDDFETVRSLSDGKNGGEIHPFWLGRGFGVDEQSACMGSSEKSLD